MGNVHPASRRCSKRICAVRRPVAAPLPNKAVAAE